MKNLPKKTLIFTSLIILSSFFAGCTNLKIQSLKKNNSANQEEPIARSEAEETKILEEMQKPVDQSNELTTIEDDLEKTIILEEKFEDIN